MLAGAVISLLSVASPVPPPADASLPRRLALAVQPDHNLLLVLAAALFALAAITDALDGLLARRWRSDSRFGRVMDPFADKLLIVGTFLLLAGPGFALPDPESQRLVQVSGVQSWMVAVILARELLVTSIRGACETEDVQFGALALGKFKMTVQSLAAPAIILLVAIDPTPQSSPTLLATYTIAWLTVLITVVSAVPYLHRAMRSGRPRAAPSPPHPPA